jgi:hypothetical protein
MSPGASIYHSPPKGRGDHGGAAWATAIAIVFAMVAAISFVVDQSVTLSSLPVPPPASGTSR